MKQFHYTYIIVNNKNGRYYIGKHSTESIDDGYMGSGKLLRKAIKKYGIESFTKEVYAFYDSEKQCLEAEKQLISIHINDPDCYNIAGGGVGGLTTPVNPMQGKKHKPSSIEKMRQAKLGKVVTETQKNKVSEYMIERVGIPVRQLTLSGELIAIHDSISKAALSILKDPKIDTGIKKCLLGAQKTAYGFKWEKCN